MVVELKTRLDHRCVIALFSTIHCCGQEGAIVLSSLIIVHLNLTKSNKQKSSNIMITSLLCCTTAEVRNVWRNDYGAQRHVLVVDASLFSTIHRWGQQGRSCDSFRTSLELTNVQYSCELVSLIGTYQKRSFRCI